MRLLVCGGRDYNDLARAWRAIDAVHAKRGIEVVIHGDYRGADILAKNWAISRGLPHLPFPADWRRLGPRAGPVRNQRMLDEGVPDGVIALPGGNGTLDMIARAERAGLRVWRPYG